MASTPLHFLDPSRPRISGLPAFRTDLNPAGLSIIPGLYFSPNPDNTIEISGFFSTGRNACSRRCISIPASEFQSFWTRWIADPEGVAESDFKWTPLAPTTAPVAPVAPFDLDDLLGAL